jgi:hypothetical protein
MHLHLSVRLWLLLEPPWVHSPWWLLRRQYHWGGSYGWTPCQCQPPQSPHPDTHHLHLALPLLWLRQGHPLPLPGGCLQGCGTNNTPIIRKARCRKDNMHACSYVP